MIPGASQSRPRRATKLRFVSTRIALCVVGAQLSAGPAHPQALDSRPWPAATVCGHAVLAGAAKAETAQHTVYWRADPPKIPVAAHFAIELLVCPRAQASRATAIAVDARMPAHGHGMNYKPSLRSLGGDRYRVEGLMLHMPGSWELVFEVTGGDGTRARATQTIQLR